VYSSNPSISGDGRWVAYQIGTRDPLDPAICCERSAWIYDRQAGLAEPVSVFPDGTLAQTHDPDNAPDISDDGRFVVFVSSEALDPTSPTFAGTGLYVHDVAENRTTLVNRNAFGVPAPEQMFGHTLADDGRYVAFTSLSTNLVANDTNGASDVFLRANPTPRVESVTPPAVPRGRSVILNIVGDGFAPAPTAGVSGEGVAVTAVTRLSEHKLSVKIKVDKLALTGPRTVIVKNTGTGPGPTAGDSGACSGCLTIT
jgi:Tol biopolymer transport system component